MRNKIKKSVKRELSVKGQFKEARIYLKECKIQIYIIVGLFFLSIIFGYVNYDKLGIIDGLLKGLVDRAGNLSSFELFFFILQNNLLSSFLGFVFGILFGLFPVITCIFNGVVLGYVMHKSVDVAGIFVVWRLLPHGIFELPAVFISLALGLKLGMSVFAKDQLKEFKRRFLEGMNVFLMIIMPLLILAAFIETLLVFFVK